MMQLSPNSRLQGGKYTIQKVLGQGGFGITYLAKTKEGTLVAVKEFFMKDSCMRAHDSRRVTVPSQGSRKDVERYRMKFVKEAKRLLELDHPNIVKVYDVFEENDTNYYVMQYMQGGSLSDNVKQFGPMDETTAKDYILQVALALRYMHQEKHICHYDVKPGNILLDNGKAVLIDFGLSKNYDGEGQQTTSTPVGISAGYAPIEQYNQSLKEFSPTTDIYALGATLYFLLTGKNPPEASVVLEQGGLAYPVEVKILPPTWNAICQAMMPIRPQRLQSIDAFCWMLDPTGGVMQGSGQIDDVQQTVTVENQTPYVQGLYGQAQFSGQGQTDPPPQNNQLVQPKTMVVQSVLVMLFCCLPFGIVALVNALKVSDRFNRGLYYEAQQASRQASTWVTVGFFVGLFFYLICISVGINHF